MDTRGIIHKAGQGIKGVPKEVLLLVILVLTAILSFGLGRLSVLTEKRPEVGFAKIPTSTATAMAAGGLVVGSKTGAKYHFPWCPGALQISDKNKVWFKDENEARQRGYTPAGNCKGL